MFAKYLTFYQYCQLACFYVNNIDGNPENDYVNKEHVFEWTLTQLRPKSSLKVREMMYDSNEEIEVSIGGEWIVENLCLNDNVLVPTSIDEPFWILLVSKGPHIVATLTWPSVGVKPNTWKELGFGVLRDSRMFRARQQGEKHLALGCSWCHWKGLET